MTTRGVPLFPEADGREDQATAGHPLRLYCGTLSWVVKSCVMHQAWTCFTSSVALPSFELLNMQTVTMGNNHVQYINPTRLELVLANSWIKSLSACSIKQPLAAFCMTL
jgi:hypothetical protein